MVLFKAKKIEGRKFTRQKSIGNFIIDFYCPEEKLAIELDGEQHFWEEGKPISPNLYHSTFSRKAFEFLLLNF